MGNNLTVEGEEALRLYVTKHRHLLDKLPEREQDPLSEVIGALSSPAAVDALKDLKRLELGERLYF